MHSRKTTIALDFMIRSLTLSYAAQLFVQQLVPGNATALEPNLSQRQTCDRSEFQHELIVHNGPADGQLRYFKLDGVFLQCRRRPLRGYASIAESCSIPPHQTVQPACHRKLSVSGWGCRRSGRETNRRHAPLRAVPECGQVESWSEAEPALSQAAHAWERLGLSSRLS
jgi:hypothetical protein